MDRHRLAVRAGAHARRAGNGMAKGLRWVFSFNGGWLRRGGRVLAVGVSSAGLVLMVLAGAGLGGAAASTDLAVSTVANPAPPAGSGWPTNCTEGSFLSVTSASGSPGQTVTVGTYTDETPVNTDPYTGSSKNGIVPPNGTYAPQWGIVAGGTWTPEAASAIGFNAGVKTTPISVTIPTLAGGSYTGWVLVFDSDQNKSGGDCGIASFSITVAVQTLAGHIYQCVNGLPSTTEVIGGTLQATGPQAVNATANPLAPTNVAAGTYAVTAFAPSAYQFVSCGGPPITPVVGGAQPGALENVVVPSGGAGVAVFYVVRPSGPQITVSLVKANDADGSGTYTQDELAASPGAAVPFRLVVTNTSSVPVTISALTDAWPGRAAFSPSCATALVGTTLAAGASATCAFTLTGYSPAAGSSLTNTATVIACQASSSSNCGTATSTSTVRTIPTSPSGSVTLTLTKANAANGSGAYSQSETAPAAHVAVPFRLVVTNTSSVAVVIGSLSDVWPGVAPFSPSCATALVGTTLAAGASVTCDFTLAGYAPEAGATVTNTATVAGCAATNSANCASAQATSVVRTQGPATAALAFTGPTTHLRFLLVLGFALLSAGSFVLWLTRPRRALLALAGEVPSEEP